MDMKYRRSDHFPWNM